MGMNRRKFMAMIAAGGVVTATGMWMPGSKLISIPKKSGVPLNLWLMSDEVTAKWFTIYTDVSPDGLSYHAKDLVHSPEETLIFNRVQVENPTDIGPSRINLPVRGTTQVDRGDRLTLVWQPGGIVSLT